MSVAVKMCSVPIRAKQILFLVQSAKSSPTVMINVIINFTPAHLNWVEGVSEWVGGWVSGWVGEWVGGWVSEWVSEWVGEWVSEWVSGGFTQWAYLHCQNDLFNYSVLPIRHLLPTARVCWRPILSWAPTGLFQSKGNLPPGFLIPALLR